MPVPINLKVDEAKKQIVITMPLQEPAPSKSGKSMVIATTNGILVTDAKLNGKPISMGVNVFYPKN